MRAVTKVSEAAEGTPLAAVTVEVMVVDQMLVIVVGYVVVDVAACVVVAATRDDATASLRSNISMSL